MEMTVNWNAHDLNLYHLNCDHRILGAVGAMIPLSVVQMAEPDGSTSNQSLIYCVDCFRLSVFDTREGKPFTQQCMVVNLRAQGRIDGDDDND